ncbi:hypothetical protein OQJ68_09395 [Microbulbifer thermotolerans]|uniref:Abortive infection C-terminus n=1 Tax=Microbulbifer thermotolerans TaxID=252514 RepID=A0AB35HXH3_MICTH|nr:hypothetical protein [Microbulbifer thermotolerans]MCX2802000.1 hypothetical protein [Microbulbifer thermotolerans]
MSHKWEFSVSAGSYYPSLTQSFRGNDISLAYEDDHLGMQFYGYSSHIDCLSDPSQVAKRLYSLQILLNGALRISSGGVNMMPITFGAFALCDGGCRGSVYADSIEECPFDLSPSIDEGLPSWNDPKSSLPSLLLNRSKHDEKLRGLLFLVGMISTNSANERVLTWSTLYKILDSVKHYSSEFSLPYDSFADKDRINEFTAACNNMSILGINARHGASGNKPPKRVITDLAEAIELIVSLSESFVREYLARVPFNKSKHPDTASCVGV